MLFSVGTRVKFKHSDDAGVVTALLDGEMVTVLLDDGEHEIPAFINDLIRAEDHADASPSVKAKILSGRSGKKNTPPERPPAETQYTILKSKGIQLAFAPFPDRDISPEKFLIYLLNDTRNEFLFTFKLQLRDAPPLVHNGKLPGITYIEIGALLFDQLNDSPVVEIECWRITTEGTGGRLHKKLRIKPKQFFKRTTTAPLLNKNVHLFKIFDKGTFDRSRLGEEEDLRSYTKRNTRPASPQPTLYYHPTHDILEFAEFIPELDLHIEKISKHHRKLNNAEILRHQLQHFEAYLQQAIRLGVERVFIIHGVGTGKLRDQIATQLIQNPDVKSFKNEFHPRYGWGATEVIF